MAEKPFELDNSKLKKIRKKAGILAKDFAVKVGKNPPDISNYETAVANPPSDVLLGYLILCDAEPQELLKNNQN